MTTMWFEGDCLKSPLKKLLYGEIKCKLITFMMVQLLNYR